MNSTPRTAYILQIHQNPEQVNKFIEQLISEKQADVFVHIDKRNYENMYNKIIRSPHVKVLKQCVVCEWGDISQVDATLLLLKEVISSNNNYDFVCLRSGQDLLVKGGFKDFLFNNKEKVFIDYRKMYDEDLGFMNIRWPKVTRRRYTATHPIRIFRRILISFYSKGIKFSPNKNYWPDEYLFYKGSQWFSLPFEVVKYIMEFLEKNKWYYEFFENTLVPDESFFHTLILNSHYKNRVVKNNLMFFKWGESLNERNSPQDITMDDIQLIEESGQYFSRKFNQKVDNQVIEYFVNKVKFDTSDKDKRVERYLS